MAVSAHSAWSPEAVLVRQFALSLPIPHRLLLATQPKRVTPVLQVVKRVIRQACLMHTNGMAR